MTQLDLIAIDRRPVEYTKNGMLHRNHGTWEERNFHGYRQTREDGGAWIFYVPWFSALNDRRCSVSLFDGGKEDNIEIDEANRIKIRGKWYQANRWDH